MGNSLEAQPDSAWSTFAYCWSLDSPFT